MDRGELQLTAELVLIDLDDSRLTAFENSVGELLDHLAVMSSSDVTGLFTVDYFGERGQRIHDHKMLLETLPRFGLKADDLTDYVNIFKYGCPPHGGFAIGLERLTQQILGLANVKEASLFPRDRKRVRP
ncbi:MAG: hypothetical protein KOO61_09790 [Spirochaetales bacterium]|nr:hypothetical protein [Spirochaetales bacterium]